MVYNHAIAGFQASQETYCCTGAHDFRLDMKPWLTPPKQRPSVGRLFPVSDRGSLVADGGGTAPSFGVGCTMALEWATCRIQAGHHWSHIRCFPMRALHNSSSSKLMMKRSRESCWTVGFPMVAFNILSSARGQASL